VALAQRWVIHSTIVLAQADPATPAQYADLRRRHLGSDDPARLPALHLLFERMRTDLRDPYTMQCAQAADPACATGGPGASPFGSLSSVVRLSGLTLCPSLFALAPPEAQAEAVPRILLSRRIAASAREIPGLASFARALTERFQQAPPPLPQTLPPVPEGHAIA